MKPGNVLVGRNGRVYLTDFGIARIVDAPHKTVADTMIGTPAFLAPEQVAGERVGPPADVYALGLLLLEALTGHREYPGAAMESAVARLHRDPVIPGHLSPPWRSLLAAMTARSPGERPTAAQVERRLRTILDGSDATTVSPLGAAPVAAAAAAGAAEQTAMLPAADRRVVSRPAAPPPSSGPSTALIALLIIIALAAVGAAVYLATRSSGSPTPTPSPSASVSTTPSPTPTPSPSSSSPSPSPSPSPSESPTPSQSPTPSPSPSTVSPTPPPSPSTLPTSILGTGGVSG